MAESPVWRWRGYVQKTLLIAVCHLEDSQLLQNDLLRVPVVFDDWHRLHHPPIIWRTNRKRKYTHLLQYSDVNTVVMMYSLSREALMYFKTTLVFRLLEPDYSLKADEHQSSSTKQLMRVFTSPSNRKVSISQSWWRSLCLLMLVLLVWLVQTQHNTEQTVIILTWTGSFPVFLYPNNHVARLLSCFM